MDIQNTKELSKFDLHLHSCYSKDGVTKPKNIARIAKQRGLAGLAITDHNTTKAWQELSEECGSQGILFILGEEIKTYKNGVMDGEVIGLFLNEAVKSKDLFEVIDEIKQQDALLVVPHPFDTWRKNLKSFNEIIEKIDALETFNARAFTSKANLKAQKLAQEKNLAVTGGSDGHTPKEIGNAYTLAEAQTLEDLRSAIKKKETKAEGKRSSIFVHLNSTLAKAGLLKDNSFS